MKSIIQFTCPQCGGHQLMLVERAMHRYVVQSLEADRQGGLVVGHKVLVDDLCGEPLGYRCADCRHPDCHNHDSSEGFQWYSLEEVQSAGAIVWPGGMETVEHRCMVCFSSLISQREGAPICTGTRTGHPWHPDQSVGLRYSNIGLPQLEAGQKVCSATIFVHSGVSRILWLRFNSYINERKQHEEIHYRRHCCTYYVDGYLHDDWSVTDLLPSAICGGRHLPSAESGSDRLSGVPGQG